MQRLYIATEKFDPSHGTGWGEYMEWSGLTQLTEVVSLDGTLCPTALGETKDSYWPHIVNEDWMLDFFVDLEFLLSELADTNDLNILGAIRRPSEDVRSLGWNGFTFMGYDLLDKNVSISALSNCGGFPDVFANAELSNVGLLDNFNRAVAIRDLLHKTHPEERHADCHLWAVFRRQGN
jgi:hypothetical protein